MTTPLSLLRSAGVRPDQVRSALAAMLADDPVVATAVVLDLLAGEPRIKPSRGLLIDPGDDARRRWDCRVAAAATLLASAHADRVRPELEAELADADLADDVRALSASGR